MIEEFRRVRRRVSQEIGRLVFKQAETSDPEDWRLRNKYDDLKLWQARQAEADREIKRIKSEIKQIRARPETKN